MKIHPTLFIGSGRITRIMLEAWSNQDHDISSIAVTDINPEIQQTTLKRYPDIMDWQENFISDFSPKLIFLAVHPPAMESVLMSLSSWIPSDALLISLVPKWTISKISSTLNGFDRIARCIPNAPSIINQGYNPTSFSSGLDKPDREIVLSMLAPLGECPPVREEDLELYAVLTAMGPTYFWFQWQNMLNFAGQNGMETPESRHAIARMIEGAIKLWEDPNLDYQTIEDLIPVKPLAPIADNILAQTEQQIQAIYQKIKP